MVAKWMLVIILNNGTPGFPDRVYMPNFTDSKKCEAEGKRWLKEVPRTKSYHCTIQIEGVIV